MGIDPDNMDGYTNDSGFDLTYEDQLEYNKWLASEAVSVVAAERPGAALGDCSVQPPPPGLAGACTGRRPPLGLLSMEQPQRSHRA